MRLVMPDEDYTAAGYWKNENVYQYLRRAANECPEKVAVVDGDELYAYERLHELVQRLAGAIGDCGVGEEDVVSFQLPNWSEAVVAHQASAMIGAISNPIMPIYRSREVGYILRESGTKVLFIPYVFRGFDYLEMVRSLVDDVPTLEKVVVVDKYLGEPELDTGEELYPDFLATGPVRPEFRPVDESSVALLLYTSGTTADPKGVLHTHNTLLYENRSMIERYELGADDVVFMPSPVTHITGLLYGLELPFMIQGKVVLQDVWDPDRALQLIVQEGGTWTVGATPFLRGVVQRAKELGSEGLAFKSFVCGGADIPPELIKEATRVLGHATPVYGSSEQPTLTGCGYDDPVDKAAHTDGRLFEGASAKIVDESGNELPAGEVGEIASKGPDMFLGYTQPEHNEAAFTHDGYFLTGDLAFVDDEGYFKIVGRKKDIIIRGGENISVKEVEDLLYEHPKVSEVAIVAMPDPELGEKACAYIVPSDGETLSFDEVKEFLMGEGIAKQKLPERLEIVDEMPTTASGKIQKYVLREKIKHKLEA